MQNEDSVAENVVTYSRVKSVNKLDNNEDVYCLSTHNGNFIANGIIVKNCDALRYCLATHKVPSFSQKSSEEIRDPYRSNLHPGGSKWP